VSGSFLTATLSGAVVGNQSTSYASFGTSPDPEVTLGGLVIYELDTSKTLNTSQYGYTIASPQTGNPAGRTSLQGNISAAPDPTPLTLTGVAFAGLVFAAVSRRRRTA
jgi:MYXO-CTERM domain-containing protein